MVLTYIRPDADDTDGGWTTEADGTSLFGSVDESSAVDTDYIKSGNQPDHDIVKLRLSDPSVPLVQRPTTVRYRYRKKGEASLTLNLTATLLQGSTEIASWTHTDISTSFVTAEQSLTVDQFNAISDFTDLFIQFDAYSDWWLVDSTIDMHFEADLYHEEITEDSSCVFLMHADGTDASTTFIDATGRHSITANGNAQIDTAQSKFGGASALFDGTGDYLSIPQNSDFTFDGDLTIDMWVYQTTATGNQQIYESRSTEPEQAVVIYLSSGGPRLYLNGSNVISSSAISLNTWTHIEVTRSSGTFRLFVNGTSAGTNSNSNTMANNGIQIGGSIMTGNYFFGNIDELRVIKGTAAHTSNFTPPTLPYAAEISGPYAHLSISRASPATTYAKTSSGTLTAFAANTLRITDLGLLIEDSRVNRALQSADFSTTWGTINASIVTNQAAAPDGTTTMDELDEGSGSGRHTVYQLVTGFSANTTVTFSVFVKDVDRRYVQLLINQAGGTSGAVYCYADLQTGTITDSGTTGVGALTAATIEAFGNGVYRVSLAGLPNTTETQWYCNVSLSDRSTQAGGSVDVNGMPDYVGTNKSVYAWGAQFEQGAFPSSYIPTTSASVTRAADVVTTIGGLDSMLRRPIGSVMADIISPNATDSNMQWAVIVGPNDGATAHLVTNNNFPNTQISSRLFPSGQIGAPLGNSLTLALGVRDAVGWDSSGGGIVGAGGTVGTASVSVTLTSSAFQIGRGTPGGVNFHGYFRRLTSWSSRVANATLQDYTDPGTTLSFPVDSDTKIDFDFESGQYYAQPAATDFLSCSRASTGYAKTSDGYLVNFAANQLRITDLGLLVEDARTNICLRSAEFGTTWTLSGTGTLTADNTTAPDGTSTADKFVPNTGNTEHYIAQGSMSISGSVAYAGSVYLKNAGLNFGGIYFADVGVEATAQVNLTTGAITGHKGGAPPDFFGSEVLANGWIRIWAGENTATATANGTIRVYALPDSSTNIGTAWIGNDTDGIYCWGAQVEQGGFPSSYIPTTSSSATRAADSITVSGMAGAICIAAAQSEVIDVTYGSVANNFGELLGEATGPNDAQFYNAIANDTQIRSAQGGANIISANAGSGTLTGGAKVGYAQGGGTRSIVMNAGTVAGDSNPMSPTPPIYLGGASNGVNGNQARVRRFTLWTSRLADATLQGHTQP